MTLNNTNDVHERDEILLYLRGRMLTSMEACWRILHYDTYPPSVPSVVTLPFATKEQLEEFNNRDKTCETQVYFCRPKCLENMKFIEFYSKFSYSYTLPTKFSKLQKENIKSNYNKFYSKIDVFHIKNKRRLPNSVYIYARKGNNSSIICLGTVSINTGEKYYMRMFVYNHALRNYEDAYIDNHGNKHSSIQTVCRINGYLNDQNEAEQAFNDCILSNDPKQLRLIFVQLTINGFPTIKIIENDDNFDLLSADIQESNPFIKRNKLLSMLYDSFQNEGKNMGDYGLPLPLKILSILDKERLKINSEYALNKLNELFQHNQTLMK